MYLYMVASKYSRSEKIVILCNYILRPATEKILEAFLEAIFWKPFQIFRRILNDVSIIETAMSLQFLFQSRNR